MNEPGRILISGAAGWSAAAIVERLHLQGYRVSGLDLPGGHDSVRTDEGCDFVEFSPAEATRASLAEASQKRATKDEG